MLSDKYPKTIKTINEFVKKFIIDYEDTCNKFSDDRFKITKNEVIEAEWVSLNISDV
jgi:hypothetical protein